MMGHSVLAYYKEQVIDDYQITNLAKVGTIAQDGVKMLEKTPVKWSDFDVVILMYGINELYYRFKLERLITGLRTIIERIHQSDPYLKIILPDIIIPWKTERLDPETVREWNEAISQLRLDYQCRSIDWNRLYNDKNQIDSLFSIDGIHLNNKGYNLFNEELSKTLKILEA